MSSARLRTVLLSMWTVLCLLLAGAGPDASGIGLPQRDTLTLSQVPVRLAVLPSHAAVQGAITPKEPAPPRSPDPVVVAAFAPLAIPGDTAGPTVARESKPIERLLATLFWARAPPAA